MLDVSPRRRTRRPSRLDRLGARTLSATRLLLLAGIVAALLVLLAGPLSRIGVWQPATGLALLRAGVVAACAVALVAATLTLVLRRRAFRAARYLAFGITVLALLAAVPPIVIATAHPLPASLSDVSTDAADPPAFAVLEHDRQRVRERAGTAAPANPRLDTGRALEQVGVFPDIGPVFVDAPPLAVFAALEELMRRDGIDIVDLDEQVLRIEGVARSTWFGFQDDVVAQVRATRTGSRVDLRSAAHEPRQDYGANVDRVQRLLRELRLR